MKKLLFALSIAVLLMSCNKEEEKVEFEATDVTGTTIVSGIVTKNAFEPAGGGWAATGVVGAEGVKVTVVVKREDLYPNSNAQGADVYTATTDAGGNYSINVKSNANGVPAIITIETFTCTLDTLLGTQVKTGDAALFNGGVFNRNLVMGSNHNESLDIVGAHIYNDDPEELEIGEAKVRGFVKQKYEINVRGWNGLTGPDSAWVYTYSKDTTIVKSGVTVHLEVEKDPTTLEKRIYTTTTNSSGFFEFTIETVEAGTAGFASQEGVLKIYDNVTTENYINRHNEFPTVADVYVTGPSGVFQEATLNVPRDLFSNIIETNQVITYNVFVADE